MIYVERVNAATGAGLAEYLQDDKNEVRWATIATARTFADVAEAEKVAAELGVPARAIELTELTPA